METTISQESIISQSIVARILHKAILVIAIVLAVWFFIGFKKPYTLEQAYSLIIGLVFIKNFLALMREGGLRESLDMYIKKYPEYTYKRRLLFYRICAITEGLIRIVVVFLIHYGSKLLVQIVR